MVLQERKKKRKRKKTLMTLHLMKRRAMEGVRFSVRYQCSYTSSITLISSFHTKKKKKKIASRWLVDLIHR
jgi:hypothetical protein